MHAVPRRTFAPPPTKHTHTPGPACLCLPDWRPAPVRYSHYRHQHAVVSGHTEERPRDWRKHGVRHVGFEDLCLGRLPPQANQTSRVVHGTPASWTTCRTVTIASYVGLHHTNVNRMHNRSTCACQLILINYIAKYMFEFAHSHAACHHARCGQRATEHVRDWYSDTRALVAAACATTGTELPSLLYVTSNAFNFN